jgi:alkylated DNA repair dioxygenase AlkB
MLTWADSEGAPLILSRVLAVQNGECYHCPAALADVHQECFDALQTSIPWTQGKVRVRGNTWPERRLTCLFSDSPGETYHYSGKEMVAVEWDSVLAGIRERVERICEGCPELVRSWEQTVALSGGGSGRSRVVPRIFFDTCLCNYYRGKAELPAELDPETGLPRPWKPDTISWHSDGEEDLLPDAPIASVSLGAVRRFDLRPNAEEEGRHRRAPIQHDDVRTDLASGSLFVMGRRVQAYNRHQVAAQMKVVDARINCTFRVTKAGLVRRLAGAE